MRRDDSRSSEGIPEVTKPTSLAFAYGRAAEAIWSAGSGALVERDLGITTASNGAVESVHRRADGDEVTVELSLQDVEFYFAYVLRGSVTATATDGDRIELTAGDSFFQRVPGRLTMRYSPDFEGFDIVSRGLLAEIDATLGSDPSLTVPEDGSQTVVTRDTPDAYVAGAGPRTFFTYRDLGVAKGTGGRVHIQMIRLASLPREGTGWHIHSMDQFFFQVDGKQRIAVEGQGRVEFQTRDVMAIPAGTRHDVDGFSEDYACVEVCIPDRYETIPTAAPVA